MSAFPDRLLRAAKLDPSLYEEVEKDETALGEATKLLSTEAQLRVRPALE